MVDTFHIFETPTFAIRNPIIQIPNFHPELFFSNSQMHLYNLSSDSYDYSDIAGGALQFNKNPVQDIKKSTKAQS
jgi:hypothetical protein